MNERDAVVFACCVALGAMCLAANFMHYADRKRHGRELAWRDSVNAELGDRLAERQLCLVNTLRDLTDARLGLADLRRQLDEAREARAASEGELRQTLLNLEAALSAEPVQALPGALPQDQAHLLTMALVAAYQEPEHAGKPLDAALLGSIGARVHLLILEVLGARRFVPAAAAPPARVAPAAGERCLDI